MKKHDEGYALLLVVVVIVVLSIVSAGLMSLGLRNMKSQKASIDRMVDKYAAQGEIEMIVAKLSQEKTLTADSGKTAEDQLKAWILEQSGVEPSNLEVKETEAEYSCTVTISATSGTAEITCELAVSGKYSQTTDEFKIIPNKTAYNVYEIDTDAEGGAG